MQASTKIYKYSEVHLSPPEVLKIVDSLVDLVRKKSSISILEGMSQLELDQITSICLDDILSLLSISKTAFEILNDGGDEHAIKSASILQRTLKKSNFSQETINIFAQYKSDWDTWFRTNRHIIPSFKFIIYLEQATEIARKLACGSLDIQKLYDEVETLFSLGKTTPGMLTINENQVMGSILAELVRGEGA